MRVHADRLHLSPSDVTGFLACEHLTTLSLAHARGEIERPEVENEQAELIFRKGLEHEHAYLESLRAQGLTVLEIPDPEGDFEAAALATAEAIHAGEADVIYQGVLANDGWRGVADFLMRQPDGTYEALDTKLARSAKPAYILQLLFYNEQLARIQGREPDQIHVLLGNGEQQSFRPQEFAAYYRRVRSRLERFVADPPPTEPYPVDHCRICDFKPLCDAYWDSVDHLSRVAGVYRSQIERLEAAGITTLAAARARARRARARRHQPRQLGQEPRAGGAPAPRARTRQDIYELIEPQPEAGFALLPDPSPGDLFFDFEGNPFWDADGSLEYLWGILDVDGNFEPLHAHDHETERMAFETFIDLVHERLARYPDLHVYHYAPYEITALKRLMGRYGTRERELDDLLRREVFVDLYRVVRNGLRASRPGYGLKELEHFLDFERDAEVKDGGASIVIFEQWMQTRDDSLLRQIDEYNREDCIATLLLRDWLLERRDEALAQFGPFPLPEPPEPRPIPEVKEVRAELRAQLLDAGEELAAQLLDYHDRERKPVWWAYFDRIEMTDEELLEDPEAISGLDVSRRARARRPLVGVHAHVPAAGAQDRRRAADRRPRHAQVAGIDQRRRARGTAPDAQARTHLRGRAPARGDRAEGRVQHARAGSRTHAARPLAARRRPALPGPRVDPPPRAFRPAGPDLRSRRDERARVLAGRSPPRHPGTARLWEDMDIRTADRAPAREREVGRCRVDEPQGDPQPARCRRRGFGGARDRVRWAQEGEQRQLGVLLRSRDEITDVEHADECVGADLAAGTAWLFARENQQVDYLFIDEAGQVSLADALAMGTAARNVVLVGDPQQLDQVIQGTHPSGSGESVLRHLLGDDATVPPDRGLFLERTYRLHPDICSYISEEFYEGRLEPAPVAAERTTPLGTGLRYLAVEHDGHRQESPEEVAIVRAEVERLRAAGITDVVVVSPFNAQVNALQEALPGHPRRHRRQVPGAGGGRRHLLDGELEWGGRPARARVPALAQPAERRDLAGALPRLPRRKPAAARGPLPLDPADAARECALPVRRAGRVRRLVVRIQLELQVREAVDDEIADQQEARQRHQRLGHPCLRRG